MWQVINKVCRKLAHIIEPSSNRQINGAKLPVLLWILVLFVAAAKTILSLSLSLSLSLCLSVFLSVNLSDLVSRFILLLCLCLFVSMTIFVVLSFCPFRFFFVFVCIFSFCLSVHVFFQGILKGEVSLYRWLPVWLVWNQLYDNWYFVLLLFAKQTNPN